MDLLRGLLEWVEPDFSKLQMDSSEIRMDFSESENPPKSM